MEDLPWRKQRWSLLCRPVRGAMSISVPNSVSFTCAHQHCAKKTQCTLFHAFTWLCLTISVVYKPLVMTRMKMLIPILILTSLIGLGMLLYGGKVNESQAELPEDEQTALVETGSTGNTTANAVDSESGNALSGPATQASIEDLWAEAMSIPSDHKLIMAEFRKIGGVVKEEALEKDIDTIVRDHFDNDRSAFVADLESKGSSLEEFKRQRHDMMAVQSVQSYITRGITDPVQKKEKVAEWLRGLR